MKVVPLMPSPKLPISNYCTPTAKREKFVPSVEFLTAWKSVFFLIGLGDVGLDQRGTTFYSKKKTIYSKQIRK